MFPQNFGGAQGHSRLGRGDSSTFQHMQMFNQYLIISLASIIRFGFDVMIIISTFKEDVFSSTCAPAGDDNMIFGIVFMLAIGLIGDYFPVFIILRIYTLE